ncbi:hypothetical protein [Mucilaginibacter rubeus]|uniref:Uncharacterized protein n=1 Tax=Mucilaginibacter rubeus TaxID=2027860 RepID=A0A5C1HXK5_9SPHI|nr:hypothetical protein [Mucilaginibacter rubeus]QEM10596.1 hypothetical protein DEO27_011385 [Mucilaginibacter rubeus]
MDLNGLSSITNQSEMQDWLAENLVTPVTPAITASDLGLIMQRMVEVSGGGDQGLLLFDLKNSNYSLQLSDKAIEILTAAPNTVTVPQNADVAFPIGKQIVITQSGPGQTTIVPASGVTINSADARFSLRTRFSGATLVKKSADSWWLWGDLGGAADVIKTAYINLTNTGSDATTSGWSNNVYFSAIGSQLALSSSQGEALGWSMTAAVGTANTLHFEKLPERALSDVNYPDDVLQTLWYLDGGTSFTLKLSGLNPQKTYTVKTAATDNAAGDGPTRVTVGGISQVGASPDFVVVKLTFLGVSPDTNGNLSIIADNTAGAAYPLLNALIISED